MLKAIVACSPEGIIAIDGKMPWNVSEDLKRFKSLTLNNIVIYGRKTYESFDKKPLPGRTNYVVGTTLTFSDIANTNATAFYDLNCAINTAQIQYPKKDVWICGGASIYEQTLPIVDELELTIIKPEQVCYHDGVRTYLKGYPDVIENLFEMFNEYETERAIYRSFKRRSDTISSKARTILS